MFDLELDMDLSGRPRRPPRERMDYLPPEEQQSLMAALAQQTTSAFETLGRFLDYPGAIARGALVGKPTSGFAWDYDTRVSGEELLDYYGIRPKNPYVKAIAGLAAEIGTDPLAWLSLPKAALTPAGRAAAAATAGGKTLLDLAPQAATAKLGYSQAAKTLTGRYTDDALKKLIPELPGKAGQPAAAATAGVLEARPLLGPRYSRSMSTLDDVIKQAADPKAAMDQVLDYLKANNLSWSDVSDQKLGGLLGFGSPFGKAEAVWSPSFQGPILDALDLAGQKVAWSAPVRYGSAWFSKPMDGASGVAEQIDALRKSAKQAERTGVGRRLASQYLTAFDDLQPEFRKVFGPEGLSSSEANQRLLRFFENKATPDDQRILSAIPGFQDRIQDWDVLRKGMIGEARDLGLRKQEYRDPYGTLWSPYHAAEIAFKDKSRTGRAALATSPPESIGRKKYLQTPGGKAEAREISMLPMVREHAELGRASPHTNAEVGESIREFLRNRYGRDVLNPGNASKQAAFYQNIKSGVPSNYPVGAEHPLNAQARAILNHQQSLANYDLAMELLTENAIHAYQQNMPGGGFKALDVSVKDVARTIGLEMAKDGTPAKAVERQVLQRLKDRFGSDPGKLSEWVIPQSVFDRVTRAQKIYESPQEWQDVWSLFEKWTTVFKGFVLAWPSRHVRDAYSNAFSAWLEVGNAVDTISGMKTASEILAGNWNEAMPFLRQLSRYSGMASDDAIRKAVISDAGGSGVLATLASSDLLSARQRAAFTELVPGSSPVRLSDALKELTPDGTRTLSQQAKDFFTIQGVSSEWQTRNPLLNASQKINDANDSIARLGGMLALMKQGVSPDEAARRITQALVDYGSLTDVEKQVFKNVFPWWTYNSRMGAYVVKHMAERPGGRYSQTIRSLNTLQHYDEDHYTPAALRERGAFRIPDELLPYIGMDSKGAGIDTYGTNIDIAGRDSLNQFAFRDGNLDVQETLSNFLQQSHPLMRTTAELATGRDLWSKRPLDEAVTPLDRLYKKLFQTETRLSPEFKAVIQNLPGIQRPLSLFGGLADDRLTRPQRAIKQIVNQVSGLGIASADKQWIINELLRNIDEQELRGVNFHGGYSFIPEALQPELTPRQAQMYALQKQLEREQADIRKQKRAAR